MKMNVSFFGFGPIFRGKFRCWTVTACITKPLKLSSLPSLPSSDCKTRQQQYSRKENHQNTTHGLYLPPHPITVTKRIITFLVAIPCKPSFATGILGGGRSNTCDWITTNKSALLDFSDKGHLWSHYKAVSSDRLTHRSCPKRQWIIFQTSMFRGFSSPLVSGMGPAGKKKGVGYHA